ncbi:tail fiber protein [Niveispirillum sp. BGYR6]|uniref:phage tail protein n=1 Tax=Niveispirillum sp. BGYR6 TaxID=2971249 RepID=UPI0022B99D98|nr:tail fiber protein [Niveispirillum sp. BGYR6]MDG5497365.1 tail fiber protein [Niveispirillum sp. BGYR6]
MSEPYVGQIMFGAFGFAPQGYALCDGATLSTHQNQALFALIGFTYGGNRVDKFNLPDLRGRVVMGAGQSPVSGISYRVGQSGGAESVTLAVGNMPSHTHFVGVSNAVGTAPAASNIPAQTGPNSSTSVATTMYGPSGTASQLVKMADQTISQTGGSGAHSNMQPFQVANAIIALTGVFPARP